MVVDPAQLEASLVNLANNARDAMPRCGRLSIVTANRSLDADYAAIHPDAPFDFSEKAYLLPRDVALKAFVDQWLHIAEATGALATSKVYDDSGQTETNADITATATEAENDGLSVMFRPLIDFTSPVAAS